MHGNVDLDDPTTVALAVAEAFRGAGTAHALYGGLLLAAYGEPRETFVIFKALSTRESDLQDAASVLRRTGERMDASWIESEIQRLAAEIPDHDAKGRWSEIRRQAGGAGAPG